MPWNPKPIVNLDQVIKIEVLELPQHREVGEGEYELRYAHRPKEPMYHDIMSLKRLLDDIWPAECENILDRLQNFQKAYLNLGTGEITS